MYKMKIPTKRSLKSKLLGAICFAVIFYFGFNTFMADIMSINKEEDFGQHPIIFVGGYKRSGKLVAEMITILISQFSWIPDLIISL